jgi:hypothetical protein
VNRNKYEVNIFNDTFYFFSNFFLYKQLDRLSNNSNPVINNETTVQEEEEIVYDDDYRLKLKMMLYLQSLFNAVDIGINI